MNARKRAVGNGVAIDVKISAKGLAGLEVLALHQFCRGHKCAKSFPAERRAKPIVHADVEIFPSQKSGSAAVRKVQCLSRPSRTIRAILRKQHHMFGSPWLA